MKKRTISAAFLFLVCVCVLAGSFEEKIQLPEEYEKWLKEDVAYIITPTEKDVFLKLETNKDRDLFIDEFWRQRDPTPGTPGNELKEEHYNRIQFANERFGPLSPLKGWQTDRGKTYIVLGSPYHVEKFHTIETYPIELWYYHGDPKLGQPPVFRLLFFRRGGGGEYELYSPMSDGPKDLVHFVLNDPDQKTILTQDILMGTTRERFDSTVDALDREAYKILKNQVSFELAAAAFSNFPGRDGPQNRLPSEIMVQQMETLPHRNVQDDYAYEFLEHKAVVEVSYSVHFMGNQNLVNVIQDPTGLFFVNYTIVPDSLSVDFFQDKYFTNLRLSLRVTNPEGQTIFQRERNVPLELREKELKIIGERPFHLCDSFPLILGQYKLNLLLENTVTKEFTSFERDIYVPDPDYLNMSLPILSRLVHKGLPQGQAVRAYQIGDVQIYPSLQSVFHVKDTLYVFFQIFGMSFQQQEKGMLEFIFLRGEKAFRTVRKKVSEYTNARDYLEEFSLEDFSDGQYTLKVALLDKEGNELLQAKRDFSVSRQPQLGSWYVAQTNPPVEDPFYHFARGNQLLNKREMGKAVDELKKAHEGRPESLEYALSYGRALMIAENFKEVINALTPYAAAGYKKFELFYYLGEAAKRIGETEAAIGYYQKAITQKGNVVEVLNSIGSCYRELGNTEEALLAWEKSLEVSPDQEKIKKIVEELKKK
jgi:GWxTD domain-containing protein